MLDGVEFVPPFILRGGLCVSCCKSFSFISVESLFVAIALLSFKRRNLPFVLWLLCLFLISSNFILWLRILALRFGVYCLWMFKFKHSFFERKGVSNFKKRRTIFRWCRRKNADVIFLQETHSNKATENQWQREWG